MSTNRFTIGGLVGEVRWGYHPAASIGKWTIVADASGQRLTADIVRSDAYQMAQQPLLFVVERPLGQQWRWAMESLQVSGSALTATLVPQE